MRSVLVVSSDTVGRSMGGLGVRNWEVAHALAKQCRVTLAIPNEPDLESADLSLASFDLKEGDLGPLAAEADVIVVQGPILHFHPELAHGPAALAVDLYIPSLLEALVWKSGSDLADWVPYYEECLRVQLELLRAGDSFFCASERQRDYWLGWLHAQKRLNPHTYLQDPTLRRLIDVVPFGLPSTPPTASRSVLKGVHPGIGPDDRVVLWSGGLWDWLDPLTLIRALGRLTPVHPELKLYFMGTKHPNASVAGMSMPDRAVGLAREIGLYEKSVFFGDWVPYDDRAAYLLEADVAASCHPGHIETRFSFRTRVLDCIWAGLPLVVTEGDNMADLVQRHELGLVVPAGDDEALAAAIERVLYEQGGRRAYSRSFAAVRGLHTWEKAVVPLLRFCLSPSRAADRGLYVTETERICRDKDAHWSRIVQSQRAALDKYEQSVPLRLYFGLKRLLGIR